MHSRAAVVRDATHLRQLEAGGAEISRLFGNAPREDIDPQSGSYPELLDQLVADQPASPQRVDQIARAVSAEVRQPPNQLTPHVVQPCGAITVARGHPKGDRQCVCFLFRCMVAPVRVWV